MKGVRTEFLVALRQRTGREFLNVTRWVVGMLGEPSVIGLRGHEELAVAFLVDELKAVEDLARMFEKEVRQLQFSWNGR